ncbi:hypothetical protein PsYK624_007740 [Phanerochaete sordida]|uniref:Phosphoglycerate mutase family protein n=1 Tax=Phanerochaete sordida TaxID=48140 RepID=A0A9P3FY39_9APHY|nr:hypothetical protein PsYK624_007740 [Phanerochaete sordida]
MRSSFTALTWIVLLATAGYQRVAADDPSFRNTVYLIRNGETNTKEFGSGLTQTGILRSQCLPSVFGPNTAQTVGYILAEPPLKRKSNVSDAVDTVIPLAESLRIPIDISCGHDDKDCVAEALSTFAVKNSTASMLVVWDSDLLPDIAEALGASDVNDWPKGRHDLIWTIQKNKIRSRASEACPGLDNVVPV